MTDSPKMFNDATIYKLLKSISEGLMSHWWIHSTSGGGVPYARIEINDQDKLPAVGLYGIDTNMLSRHAALSHRSALLDAQRDADELRKLIIKAAPLFKHPLIEWDVELMSCKNPGPVNERAFPHPDSRIFLNIAGICISADDPLSATPATLEDAAARLYRAAKTLSAILVADDRVFQVGTVHLPANTPEEALYIEDALRRRGLFNDKNVTTPEISEVFARGKIREDMQRRFHSLAHKECAA